MNVNEQVKKDESKLNENTLTDLPLVDEQRDWTKGGEGIKKPFEIKDFSFGVENPTTIG